MENNFKKSFITILITTIIVSSVFGGAMGFWAGLASRQINLPNWLTGKNLSSNSGIQQTITLDEQSAVIAAVDKVSPAVVSIIITKNLSNIQELSPFGQQFFQQFFGDNFNNFFGQNSPQNQGGTTQQEIGGGSGFIISSDGYIVTNKHVVSDSQADYTVLLNDGRKLPAKVIALDPSSDLGIVKISATNLATVTLGDSSNLKVGQTVIAIGNALGEYRNTVSTGVISGLARSISAGGASFGSEQLAGVIQTDASINPGNSGGPLLDINGNVIGINTAIVQGAQNIGFAIPINEVKASITSVQQYGKIVRAWLGVRYVLIDQALATANKLPVNYGALIIRGQNPADLAIIPGSPANKAGLAENDIILEANGQKINSANQLSSIIAKAKPGDQMTLKVLHGGKEKTVQVKLAELPQQ